MENNFQLDNNQNTLAIIIASLILISTCIIVYTILVMWDEPKYVLSCEDGVWFIEEKQWWGGYIIYNHFSRRELAEEICTKLNENYARRNKNKTI